MGTMTNEERLADIRQHIDELEERARGAATGTRARLERRLAMLRGDAAATRRAVSERAASVAERFRQLELDLQIADSRMSAELADNLLAFSDSVEAELDEWDAAIERLQTKAAAKAGSAREQAEAEIAALRQVRNRVSGRVDDARTSAAETWEEHKQRVVEALDTLEQKVRDAMGKFH